MHRNFALSTTPLVLAAAAFGQSSEVVLGKGDSPGTDERIQSFGEAVLDARGTLFVAAETDYPVAGRTTVLLEDGLVSLRAGDAVPGGGAFSSLIDWDVTGDGRVAAILEITGVNASRDQVLLFDGRLLGQKGLFVGPALPSTRYRDFLSVFTNDRGEILARVTVADPAIGGTTEEALLFYRLNEAGAVTVEVVAEQGVRSPIGYFVNRISSDDSIAFNNRGEAIYWVDDPSFTQSAFLIDDRVIAREGFLSPTPGLRYAPMGFSKADLNDFGNYVLSPLLNDAFGEDHNSIQINNEVFLFEGDTFPSIAPDTFRCLCQGSPLFLSNGGDVYWLGSLASSFSRSLAYFRNLEVILRNGDSLAQGTVTQLTNEMDVTDDGRFFVARVIVGFVNELMIQWDFGAVVPVYGCGGNTGALRLTEGLALAGGTLTFELDGTPAIGSRPMLVISGAPASLSPCGQTFDFGELLIDLGTAPLVSVELAPWNGAAASVDITLPPELALVDRNFWAQGFFFDPHSPRRPSEGATNAVRITVGAPQTEPRSSAIGRRRSRASSRGR